MDASTGGVRPNMGECMLGELGYEIELGVHGCATITLFAGE
jgi:hypothetical protein